MARWFAVVLGLAARAVVVASEPAPPQPAFYYGYVEALTSAGDLHHFTLRGARDERMAGPPQRFEVVFAGDLPDLVCEGEDTFVEAVPHDGLLVATSVHGPGCLKGIECRRWACLPEARRPPECRSLSAGSSSW